MQIDWGLLGLLGLLLAVLLLSKPKQRGATVAHRRDRDRRGVGVRSTVG